MASGQLVVKLILTAATMLIFSRLHKRRKAAPNPPTAETIKSDQESELEPPPPSSYSSGVEGHQYEVFLSFRGPDTRTGFADYLYHDLKDAGIDVFRDNEELRVGEEIGPDLLQGISNSKISIPVLSRSYASSKWCLRELALTVECRNTRGQIVLPVFYDVTPDQVRHQKGTYAASFSEHARKYGEETVEQWRDALAEVSRLKGWELKKETDGHEGQLTKKILEKVLIELKKAHLRVTDKLVGINDQEKEVKDLLEMLSNEARKVIGLWGMGGIGKTTLSKHIYNQIWHKFESCSFLGDIRQKSLEHDGLLRLQSQLASDLLKQQRRDFSSVDEGVSELERKFRDKKVLILLDDADQMDQLEALVAKIEWFGPGSRVIITTRNRDILDELLIEAHVPDMPQESWWACYEVKEMNQKTALQLFCNHAFRQDTPKDELSALSHAIAETTGGLPLALEVVGSFLSRKNKSIWEETLKELMRMPKQPVQERLRISYDRLDDDQKQMFLDVACLFIGEDIDVVIHVWKDRYVSAENGKDVLLVMSLIKIVDDNRIWMHDQLRDLGREIVRKESYRHPEKRSRLWQEDEARDALVKCAEHRSSSEVEALQLHSNWAEHYCITNEQLRNFSNIWFLKLHHIILDGDFQLLLSELRWLTWQPSSSMCFPTNLNLEKLLVLHLSSSRNIKDDWELWSSFQRAQKLKVLNLTYCMELSTLDVSMFINLERLVLDGCFGLTAISIGDLENLLFLSMKECWSIKELPDSIGKLKSLRELDLSGTGFATLPSSISNLGNLQVLRIFNSRISSLPNAILDVEKLHIIDYFMRECLEENICKEKWTIAVIIYLKMKKCLNGLESLHVLKFSGDRDYQNLHQSTQQVLGGFKGVEAVQLLQVLGCASYVNLPIPSSLKFLVRLDFHDCEELQQIEGLGELEALEELNITCCGEFTKLPSLSKLKSLRILNCSGCNKMQEVEGIGGLEALEELNLEGCWVIETLPSLSKLKSLKILNCHGCDKIQELEGLNGLEALEELNLEGCRAIEKLPSLCGFESLRILCCGCEKLQEIEGLDGLEALEELNLEGCRAIEKLPSLSGLRSLRVLNCSGSEKLQEIEGLDALEALEELHLVGCRAIEKLLCLSNLRSLRILNCRGCEKLQEVEGLDRLQVLEYVAISRCKAMRHIPVLPQHMKLKMGWLGLLGCESYEEIHRNLRLKGSPCSICQLSAEDLYRIAYGRPCEIMFKDWRRECGLLEYSPNLS